MYFLIENGNLLQKYNKICDKISADTKKESDSKPVYDKKFLRTKIKSYKDEATDFHNKEMPKVDSNHACLAVITIDSVFKKDEKRCL